MAVINTNIASINAQNNLSKSQNSLQTSLERLSSGLRINSAKDDAAGLAISNRMTSQINGLNQAVRNANDGISLAQTAEGAMSESTNILQRMRELSVQSANATNTASDRASLQKEVSQLQSELDRIANTTSFNGTALLNGSFNSQNFQVGAEAGQVISFGINSARSSDIGAVAKQESQNVVTANTATDITLAIGTGTAVAVGSSANYVGNNATYQGADSAYAKAEAIQSANISGLVVSTETKGTVTLAGGTAATGADTETYTLSVNGTEVLNKTFATGDLTVSIDDVITAVNADKDTTGVVASKSGNDLILTAADGSNIVVTEGGTSASTSITGAGDFSGTLRGKITLSSQESVTIGGTAADIGFTTTSISKDTNGIDDINISTFTGASEAILRIDSALASIDSSRADLGAIQNRFESTISNLTSVSENVSAARSRIQDADFAAETANLTKNQILQQAGTAMLAQANTLPQGVLSLLQ
ncbi:flagellin [Amphritea sp.]|uniref:flagellin n=1 Tax=Amphritea sp. TaxID=1872502 RepID=UPI003D1312DE